MQAAAVNGVRHVLAFADVDTAAELRGITRVLDARQEFASTVDMHVLALPQDGVPRDPGAEGLVRQALDSGADVVGGTPSITTRLLGPSAWKATSWRRGVNADLVVLDGSTVREVLTRHSSPRHVIHSGRVVASTTTISTLAWPLRLTKVWAGLNRP